MTKLASVVCVVGALLAGCGKKEQKTESATPTAETPKETPKEAPKQVEAKQPMSNDPSKLPAAGTAPTPVTVAKELDPMWDAPIKTLDGKDAKLSDYKGKALLLVNVASKCGLTPQYATLEALQKKYASKGFTVLGFPCNQFQGQEPGTAEEIREFCATNYGITFPIMEKIEVNGSGQHPIYAALTAVKDTTGKAGDIMWNFEKFVISADGTQVTRFRPKTTPDHPTVIAAVEAALPKQQ